MQIVINNKDDLLKYLEIVNLASGRVSELSNFLLICGKDKKLSLVTSNLEINIKSQLEAEIEKEGAVVVPIKNFTQIIRKLSPQQVVLKLKEDNILEITQDYTKFSLFGQDKDEFPLFPSFEIQREIVLNAVLFERVLEKVRFASGRDDLRPVLNGILIEIQGDNLRAVATDGFRLVIYNQQIEPQEEERSFIIPWKVVEILLKILPKEEFVNIAVDKNLLIFLFKDIVILSRQIEGEFPDYKSAIAISQNKKLCISKNIFEEALSRAELMVSEKTNCVKLSLSPSYIKVYAASPNIGEIEEVLIDGKYQGDELEILFNPRYLLDICKYTDAEVLEIEFNNSESAITLNLEDGKYFYLMMPIKPTHD